MRNRIANLNDLEQRMSELEMLRKKQQDELRAEFRQVAHSLSPIRLIKNGVQSVVGDPGLRTAAIDTAISNGAGRLGKKLIVGKSQNLIRNIAGSALHFVVANFLRNRIPIFRHNLLAQKKGAA